MSNWREQFEDESGVSAVVALLNEYYHYVALVLLVGFAFWNRARNWGNFVVNGEILFRGNDPWYHYRQTQYVVKHFPETMPFDAWTNFAVGTANAQFGTMYDQFVGTLALIIGLGNPDPQLVKMVALFAPAIVGVAIAIPIYVIGRRLGGRFAGVVGVAIFAFATDRLLSLTTVGFFDHHAPEALTQAVAVLGVMVAIRVAETDKPVYELLLDREFGVLRRSLGWGMLAGVGISVYLAVWPPGVFLLGILGVFFVIHLSLEYLRGNSPEHAAFVGAVALTTAGVLQLAAVRVIDISATSRSLLQPGLAFAVAAGCVFMAWLAREWDARDLPALGYPGAVVGAIVGGAVVMSVALPDLFDFFVDQVLRVVGFQTSPTAGTVGEAQPLPPGRLFDYYGFGIITAVAGALLLLVKQYLDDEVRGEHLLVVIWFVFIVAATLTQARFGYYMTVPVAALNAALIGSLMTYVGGVDESLDIETYQVLTVVAILLVIVAPMLVFSNPVAAAGGAQNPGGIVGWDDSLRWMSENTPAEGQYANPNGENMSYYGTFGRTEDFDYKNGTYGVMSWWDYGHWITTHGERIPVANPFQQGSEEAARFLLSQSEAQSFEVLESINEDDAKTKYVMVDWKMVETESRPPVRGKFFAPPTFEDDTNRSTFYTRILDTERLQQRGIFGSTLAIRHKQAYYNTTMARLYLYHGSAQSPQPVVLDWEGAERSFQGSSLTFFSAPSQGNPLKTFPNMTAAREFVEDDGTAQIGGIGPYPSERVPALEHYRLVHMSELTGFQGQLSAAFRRTVRSSGLLDQLRRDLGANASQNQIRQQAARFLYPNTPSWVKTFERVEGATIEGTGPANTTLRLRAQMQPQNGASFVYRQRVTTDANGDFSTTVPYATTGYDEIGPEQGYTNTSVRATSPYTITAGISVNESGSLVRQQTTVNVTEAQVVGADDSVVRADLQRTVVGQTEGGNGTSGNENNGATGSGESATNQTGTGTSTNTTGTGSDTNTTGTDSGTNGTQSLTGPRTADPDLEATRP